MLLRLPDHASVAALCDHYRRSGFAAEPVGGGVVEVTRLDAPTPEQGDREVLMHLRVWNVLHPGVAVEVL